MANVPTGKGVSFGSNSKIREKTHVGDYSLIGPGSVINSNIPNNSILVGNPGSLLRLIYTFYLS